ncbi:hypothetical protein Btru_030429 [Bulinus truncatus]|nr:hypothetical protein Btru_030429 [Bulinus truncatus]
MPTFEVALSWIVLSPVAFFQNLFAIVVVLHYMPLFHSCDVAIISLLVTMATNAFLLFPIPAVLELGDFSWGQDLCTFYVWLSLTLRTSCHLVLLVANVYWMASMRMTVKGQLFMSSKSTKLCVILAWLASIVLGIIPATGGVVMFQYYDASEGSCNFLPANIGFGFALIFIIVPMLSFIMGLLSSVDSLLLFRQIRSRVMARFNAGRFQLPRLTPGPEHRAAVHARYSELNVSTDLCRLVVIFTSVSSALNGLPLVVSQFVQMIQDHDRVAMETTLLYLLLIESLVVPHLLWLLSDRYRHAAMYTWKVFLRRDQSYREEDAAACVLQSFRFQANNTNQRAHTNGNGPPKLTNGNAHTLQGNEMSMAASPDNRAGPPAAAVLRPSHISGASDPSRGRVRTIMTTDLDDGMTVITQVTTASTPDQDVQVIRTLAIPEHAELKEARPKVPPRKSPRSFNGNGAKAQANGKAAPVAAETLQIPSSAEVSRSQSSSSRNEWKDKMRQKHLPAVFLEKSTDEKPGHDISQDYSELTYVELLDPVILKKNSVVHSPSTDSSYYLSGDFHYSYLGDSGTSAALKRQMTTESDGGTYESCDIVSVLDDELVARGVELHRGVNGDIYAMPMKTSSSRDNVIRASDFSSVTETVVSEQNSDMSNFQLHESDLIMPPTNYSYQGHTNLSKGHANVLGVEYEDGDDDIDADDLGSIEDTTALKSFIRRDNYRKFLPYTNLVISSVDLEDDQPSDHNETHIELKAEDNNLNKLDPVMEGQQRDSSVEKSVEVISNAQTSLPAVEYGRLETVSGTEMLMLKMKKVRQAIAMDSTDESNYSGDSSNDWSSDPNDPSSNKQSINVETVLKPQNSENYQEKHSVLKTQASGDDSRFDNSNTKASSTNVGQTYFAQDNVLTKVSVSSSASTASKDSLASSTQRSKHATYSSNPFLRESFEQSSRDYELRKDFYTNPFVNPQDIFIGADYFASPSTSVGASSSSARPPRLRQNSVKTRHTSSEDELDGIFEEQTSEKSYSSNNPFSKSDEADPTQDKNNESDSDNSDRSVIIKPYGRRRPAWMEDPLMNSSQSESFADIPASGSDTDTLDGSNRFSTLLVTVTDDDDDASEEVLEYDFDSVDIGGVSGGTYNSMNYMRAPVVPANSVQYHFDEDIELGFEDALSIDYVSAGPAYAGLGLCFESIKEEPEESLSESLTSLDGVEPPETLNVFKTQAVVSRPPTRASVTSPGLSCPPQVLFQENFDDNAAQFVPAFERTSADGSDDVSQLSTPPKPLLDPWGFALPDKSKKQVLLTQPFKFSVDFPQKRDDIETADDIVTSLAFKPERTSPLDHIDQSNRATNPNTSQLSQKPLIFQNSILDMSKTNQTSAYF